MKKSLIIFIAMFTSVFCIKTVAQQNCDNGFTGNSPQNNEYVLVWADEFNDNGAVCNENWHHQTQLIAGDSWANGELQHYTDRIDNSFIENGLLKIVAKRESFTDQGVNKSFTSARLNSKVAFTYGRVDVRAKLPVELGTWPAIWMLGKNISEAGAFWAEDFGTTAWPATGEIDIMEQFGRSSIEKEDIHGTTHTTAGSGGNANGGKTSAPTSTTAFHVYSIIWNETEIQFLYDDQEYYTYNPVTIYGSKNESNWPFDKPQFLLLNVAMGGVLGGNVPSNFDNATMEIDYVRVYQNYDDPDIDNSPPDPTPAPTDGPTAPTAQAGDVISIYSDAYTDVSGTDFDPFWGQAVDPMMTEVNLNGNNVRQWTPLSYQGIVLATPVDVSSMTTLHLDVWSPDITSLNFGIISTGSATPNETQVENSITTGQWNSIDIPLSSFTAPDLSIIDQLIMVDNVGGGTVYLDNIYFKTEGGEEIPVPSTAAPIPNVQSSLVRSVFSDSYTDISGVNLNPSGQQQTVVDQVDIQGNNTLLYENLDTQDIDFNTNPQDISTLDALHLDYWTDNATSLSVSLVNSNAEESTYSLTTGIAGWSSVEIPLTEFSPQISLADIIKLKFEGNGTIYLDNIFFSSSVSNPATPTVSAEAPTINSANVISLFSNAYSTISNVNYNPDLGQSTSAELIQINGDNILKYSELDLQGINFENNPQDVSTMEYLHIDYWTATTASLAVKLVSAGGGESQSDISVMTDQWVSVNIPLSELSNSLDQSAITELVFVGNGTLYVDNIFFYRETLLTQEITFPQVEDVNIEDESFLIEAESTSGLEVIFTSESEKIEISGNEILLLEPGQVTVHANQPGDATYEPALQQSVTFCVNPGKPVITTELVDNETITLISSSTIGNQWYVNGNLILNANSSTYELSTSEFGVYAVQVTIDGCSSVISDDLPIVIAGLEEFESNVTIYPNPSRGVFKIAGITEELIDYEVVDMSGRSQQSSLRVNEGIYTVDISDLTNGVYLFIAQLNSQTFQLRLIIQN